MPINLKSIWNSIKQSKKIPPIKKSILIVEDNNVDMTFIAKTLQRKYSNIMQAYDGRTGLDIAKRNQPDLIILDCILPDISGEHFCQELKQNDQTKNIPVLFLTVKTNNIVECFLAGASGWENKPISTKKLLEAVAYTFDDPGFMMD